ncbi:uncharacterized protein EMH_0080610 [Eimeria mitis]|uniref:Uncharacterized protein n=1 Tax=Eimeria mitis TaxID=44415 RepID=U6K5L6_9EIME|nr:uncharacterized protein EMH_0080610 [Eimeria mitis]CDJ33170.1 hypothetical protein, conserved [Eimeria mitis]
MSRVWGCVLVCHAYGCWFVSVLVCLFAKLVGGQHVPRWATEVGMRCWSEALRQRSAAVRYAGSLDRAGKSWRIGADCYECLAVARRTAEGGVACMLGHEVLERGVAAAERSRSLCRVASASLEAVNRLSDTHGWQQSRRLACRVIGRHEVLERGAVRHEVLERGVAVAERSFSLCRSDGAGKSWRIGAVCYECVTVARRTAEGGVACMLGSLDRAGTSWRIGAVCYESLAVARRTAEGGVACMLGMQRCIRLARGCPPVGMRCWSEALRLRSAAFRYAGSLDRAGNSWRIGAVCYESRAVTRRIAEGHEVLERGVAAAERSLSLCW